MDHLADASADVGRPDALRARLARDGYLYLPGLLPRGAVEAAAATVVDLLTRGGWVDAAGQPTGDRKALNAREALSDKYFRAALGAPAVNRIPYLAELRGLVRSLLGEDTFSLPMKVLRAVYPETGAAVASGRLVHQDFTVTGVSDLLTTWIPLVDIDLRMGGLAVAPGSHLGPPQDARVLRADEPGWATTDYRVGDVLLFHCLTSHAALPNRSDRLRFSQDSRWQRPDQAAPAESVLSADRLRDTGTRPDELFASQLRDQPWWEPVPAHVRVDSRAERGGPPPTSRLFTVHEGWRERRPAVRGAG